MVMGVRKKLIELIREVTPYWAEVLADYLLKCGVIIPVRCKYCAYSDPKSPKSCPLYRKGLMKNDDYCSVGERKDND